MIHTLVATRSLDPDAFERVGAAVRYSATRTELRRGSKETTAYSLPVASSSWANLWGDYGPFVIGLSHSSLRAEVQVSSLTSLVDGGHPRLLKPHELPAAIDEADRLLGQLGFRPLREWLVKRVDYAHDFSVPPDQLGCYLDSFARRSFHMDDGGKHPTTVRWGDTTIYWKWQQSDLRDVTLYSKFHQWRDENRDLSVEEVEKLVSLGTLRFEVRLKRLGIQELLGKLQAPRDCLTIGDAIRTSVGHRVLSQYLDALNAGSLIDEDAALDRIVAKYPRHTKAPHLYLVHDLARRGQGARTESILEGMGYDDGHKQRLKLERELSRADVAPGSNVPVTLDGLSLPSLKKYQQRPMSPTDLRPRRTASRPASPEDRVPIVRQLITSTRTDWRTTPPVVSPKVPRRERSLEEFLAIVAELEADLGGPDG